MIIEVKNIHIHLSSQKNSDLSTDHQRNILYVI